MDGRGTVSACEEMPHLSLESLRAAVALESDLGLLAALRDLLDSRCEELRQETCIKGREAMHRRCTSMSTSSETESDASTCSTTDTVAIPVSRCTSKSTMSEAESDTSTCGTTDTSANPVSSIENLPTVWDFGLFGPRSSKILQGWSIGQEIGQGRFATVFSSRSPAGRSEALKVISKKEVDAADDWANVASEYNALQNLGPHPNLVCLTGAMQSKERIYFFMDLAEGQDLFDFINTRHHVPKEAIQVISSSILAALAHCHGQGTCHRDIKPENIIVQQDYVAKLVDFGCACPNHQPQGPRCVGTLPFIAPECLTGQSLDAAPADVWSFGVVVLEMVFGLNALSRFLGWSTFCLPPFGECGGQLTALFADPSQGVKQIRSKLSTPLDSEDDAVLARMLHADPLQRPSADALL